MIAAKPRLKLAGLACTEWARLHTSTTDVVCPCATTAIRDHGKAKNSGQFKRKVRVCVYPYPVVTGRDVEDRKEGQPDDAGGVHGESDELGLVEVLRALPGLESVPRQRQAVNDPPTQLPSGLRL